MAARSGRLAFVTARSHPGPQGLVDVMVGGQVDGLLPSCQPGHVDHDFVGPMALQFRHHQPRALAIGRNAELEMERTEGGEHSIQARDHAGGCPLVRKALEQVKLAAPAASDAGRAGNPVAPERRQ
ncbi:MAG TPA: hypothetical protein VKF17_04895, partial [Isosphaeraceae bacterium]|nr:hypothetical protein [Isosphaeraceae bacterium]